MKRMQLVALFLAALMALLPLRALSEEAFDYGHASAPYCPPGLQRIDEVETTEGIPSDCFPYSAVACLDVEMACGCYYPGGTAFLVAENCLMTAGHMLVCLTHRQPVTYLRASFGYMKRDGKPDSYLYQYETTSPVYWYNSRVLTASGREGVDYGYVRVPPEAGLTVGHFGLSVRSDEELTDLPIEVVGYPSGAFIPLTGQTLLVSEQLLRHSAPTVPGHSGSPMFDADGYVVAVHNSHTITGNHVSVWCTGARITRAIIDEMRGRGFFQ